MTTDFKALLVSVEVSSNYLDPGDRLYVTTRWQNAGTGFFGHGAKLAADVVFNHEQRHLENQPDGFRFTWTPFPELHAWRPGEAWSSTGSWKVPETWGGTFSLFISIVADNGEAMPFHGEDGVPVYRQLAAEIDIGWGWGRAMLEATRSPIRRAFNDELDVSTPSKESRSLSLGDFLCCAAYPAIQGAFGRQWCTQQPVLTWRQVDTNSLHRCIAEADRPVYTVAQSNGVVYHIEGAFGSADLAFRLRGGALSISLEQVEEREGRELIGLYLPDLYQVEENGRLVNFFCGGREVPVRDALPASASFTYDVCNTMALIDNDYTVLLTTDDFEAVLHQNVSLGADKRGVMGAELLWRVAADKSGLPSIPAAPLQLELCALAGGNWQTLAYYLRDKLPEGHNSMYDDALFYKIHVDMTLQNDPNNPQYIQQPVPLSEVKRIVKAIYNMTSGIRQIVYLVGWQANGHDSEYPHPHKRGLSPRIGTMKDWDEAVTYARQHNAVLSFHDNFDDVYDRSEDTDPSWICMDSSGNPKKGWLWAGGMSYILSPKAYVLSGEMEDRVRKTVSGFHIEESYHLDVLTSETRRYDFTPGRQSAARENIAYKQEIVRCFNRLGVDVTSESLILPFVGVIGYALHPRYNFTETLFYGEANIPLTTAVFHGSIPYNMSSCTNADLLKAIAYGANAGFQMYSGSLLSVEQLRSIYLHTMPMQLLTAMKVTYCVAKPEHMFMRYGDNSSVEVDFANGTYTILVNGQKIGWNFHTFIPRPDGSYAAYTATAGEMRCRVPFGDQQVKATRLYLDGRSKTQIIDVISGDVVLDMEADVPVWIRPL